MRRPRGPKPKPPLSLSDISPTARKLYRRAIVVDGNIAPRVDNVIPQPQTNLDVACGAGITAIKTTIGGFNNDFESVLTYIAFYFRLFEEHSNIFMQIRQAGDFAVAKDTGRLGIIFSFEGVNMLEGKLDRIRLFRDLGVRVMQLSYNDASPFGSGVLTSPSAGLTELGAQAVQTMNDVGVAIDLSHANEQTTRDVMARSKRPLLMTHTGCTAVYDHPRNKTDEQLRAIAEAGGVVGIYTLPYLTPSPRQPTLEDYLAHMRHALNICGEDHVGIGSDTSFIGVDTSPDNMARFNQGVGYRKAHGVDAPGEDRPMFVEGLNTARRCEVVTDALLKCGYRARVVEKVLGVNFVRALTEIWKSQ